MSQSTRPHILIVDDEPDLLELLELTLLKMGLEQNPGTAWQGLLGGVEVKADTGGIGDQAIEEDDAFASFKL